jgi:16S rRNA (adenine1518-N6/adenine1519-N6)-dimethyltransferase
VNLARTRELLGKRGLRLRRELGQNFLVDEDWAARLVELAGVQSGDRVIEIGTGLGALTCALAARAEHVVSLEIDRGVVQALREEALLPANVTLLHVDALETDLATLAAPAPRERVRLVANLPYSAATPLLRRLLDLREHFADWSVMVQREVGARIVSVPGTRDYSSLAVLHHLAARVECVADLPAGCFFPTPKVVSSFLRVTPASQEAIGGDELLRVERVVRALFGKRRKTIRNGLRAGGFVGDGADRALEAVGIDPRCRAETLEPAVLRALTAALRDVALV